jgi:hypothetical protein
MANVHLYLGFNVLVTYSKRFSVQLGKNHGFSSSIQPMWCLEGCNDTMYLGLEIEGSLVLLDALGFEKITL